MSKKCAKCEKTVYPIEELKCLDKMWHKGCFKCQECGMTLNMRNYKGFNRLPYCTAHCPQAKHTTVADTPEIRRIQENTKIQSTVKYHEEFEKQKGKVTQIADDPETLRIRQNTKIISNIAYHGDLERKAQMEQKRPPVDEKEDGVENPNSEMQNMFWGHGSTVIYSSDLGQVSNPPSRRIGSIADYDPINDKYGSVASAVPSGQFRVGGGDQVAPQPPRSMGRTFRAMYDYSAADSDEVSFLDGDIIINCVPVDDGWMTGVVQRTGQRGMLPANYVEPLN